MSDNPFQNLPQGWEVKSLGEILSSDKYAIKRGPFGSALKKEFFVNSGIRVFEQYNPINQDSKWKRYFITQQKFKELESFKTGAGDLLISCSGTLGKILELPNDVEVGIINQALLKIRLDDKQILNSYFVYLFNSPYMQKIILENTIGSAIQNIASVKTLKQIQIPLPPLETQQKIVAKLESEFAKIEAAKNHLEKVKETIPRLKNSLLKSAFSGKLTESAVIVGKAQQSTIAQTLDLTMESNIADCHEAKASRNDESLPQGWEIKTLGEVCEKIQKRSKNYQKTEFDYIDISSINNKTNMIEKIEKYDAAKAPSRAQQIIQSNDILFSNVRTYLKNIAFVEEKYNNCIASTGFCVIRSKKDILLPKFIFYQVLSDKFISPLNMLQRGSSYPAVRNSDVLSQIVIVPPLPTQKQIVEILDSKFATLENLEKETNASLEKLHKLKSSLLNQAFKGELIC